jgi:hypothetical protein
VFFHGLDNCSGFYLHPEVDDLEIIALEHHGRYVLADVVNVAFHRGEDGAAFGGTFHGAVFEEWPQYIYGAVHGSRAFHHLRQEHLAAFEQGAYQLHALHQGVLHHRVGASGALHGKPQVGVKRGVVAAL